jgi:hypothetical protein
MMKAIHSPERRFLQEPHGAISQNIGRQAFGRQIQSVLTFASRSLRTEEHDQCYGAEIKSVQKLPPTEVRTELINRSAGRGVKEDSSHGKRRDSERKKQANETFITG